jgi:hypothetical protein
MVAILASPHGAGARGDTGAQRLCVRSDARHTFSNVAARGSVWLQSAGGGAACGPRPSLFLDEPQLHHSGRRVRRPRLFKVRQVDNPEWPVYVDTIEKLAN